MGVSLIGGIITVVIISLIVIAFFVAPVTKRPCPACHAMMPMKKTTCPSCQKEIPLNY